MRTPSLHRRVAAAGSLVVLLALIVFSLIVYFALLNRLDDGLDEVLDARLAIAVDLANEIDGADALTLRLASSGIPATVVDADGEEFHADPAVPRFGVAGPAGPPTALLLPRVSKSTALDDGRTITVYATRAGVTETLRILLVVLVVGSLGTVLLVAATLRRVTRSALDPLNDVVAAAERTAAGRLGERLEPDDPETELGRMAVAYDHMLDSLETVLEESRESEEMTRRFLADAAHQLRTPVASVRAAIEVLLRADAPEERDRMFAHAIRETSRATRLIDGLLQLARFERGLPFETEPVDVAEICRAEAERIRSVLPEVEVATEVGDREVTVEANREAVSDAIANILDNARRHAESRIRVSLTPAGERVGSLVEIRIWDDGPGLREGLEERVFERFATVGEHRGSGLGLPIARAIARAHGGDVVYEQQTFVIRLPTQTTGEAQFGLA